MWHTGCSQMEAWIRYNWWSWTTSHPPGHSPVLHCPEYLLPLPLCSTQTSELAEFSQRILSSTPFSYNQCSKAYISWGWHRSGAFTTPPRSACLWIALSVCDVGPLLPQVLTAIKQSVPTAKGTPSVCHLVHCWQPLVGRSAHSHLCWAFSHPSLMEGS